MWKIVFNNLNKLILKIKSLTQMVSEIVKK